MQSFESKAKPFKIDSLAKYELVKGFKDQGAMVRLLSKREILSAAFLMYCGVLLCVKWPKMLLETPKSLCRVGKRIPSPPAVLTNML